jgi:general nucleoside transport system permease protein
MTWLQDVVVPFVHLTVTMAVPLLLAALGEVVAERSGVINLGVEGIMAVGAFLGFSGTWATGSQAAGFLLAAMGGMVFGLLMAWLTVTLRLNQVISGLALFFVGWGLGGYLDQLVFPGGTPPRIDTVASWPLPLLSALPVMGPLLFRYDPVVYLAVALVLAVSYVLDRTPLGLSLRATGEAPAVADSLGTNVFAMRYGAVIFGSALAGVAGAYLAQGIAGRFLRLIVNGRGFIALAIVIMSLWDPRRILVGALVFAAVDALQFRIQVVLPHAPPEILLMLPYALTIAVLVVLRLVARVAEAMPAGLGQNYSPEEE